MPSDSLGGAHRLGVSATSRPASTRNAASSARLATASVTSVVDHGGDQDAAARPARAPGIATSAMNANSTKPAASGASSARSWNRRTSPPAGIGPTTSGVAIDHARLPMWRAPEVDSSVMPGVARERRDPPNRDPCGPEGDHIERPDADPFATDPLAIEPDRRGGTGNKTELDPLALDGHLDMSPRDRGVVEHDITGGAAPDHRASLGEPM